MSFISTSQEELKNLGIQENQEYLVEYKNKDYFNADETIERAVATAIINDGLISFIIKDPMGMDRFISEVRILN